MTGQDQGGHALVVVGYENSKGAVKVINSWGESWGEGGFGYISYRAFLEMAVEAYIIKERPRVALGAAPAAGEILLETIQRAESSLRSRSAFLETANMHCNPTCEQPEHRLWTLRLEHSRPDTYLKSPRLICRSGPCNGWNEVLSTKTEGGGFSAQATWTTWGHPTIWELEAEEFEYKDVSRLARRVAATTSFTVESSAEAPPPVIAGSSSAGTFIFQAGQSQVPPELKFVGTAVEGARTLYKYEVKQ